MPLEAKEQPEFSLMNRGLRIQVYLVPLRNNEGHFAAYLNCKTQVSPKQVSCRLGILLRKVGNDEYVRPNSNAKRVYDTLNPIDANRDRRTTINITDPDAALYIQPSRERALLSAEGISTFCLVYDQCREFGFVLFGTHAYRASHQESPSTAIYTVSDNGYGASALIFRNPSKPSVEFIVVFGRYSCRVWADIETRWDESEHSALIAESYFTQASINTNLNARRYAAPRLLRDRVTAQLRDGSYANVALKKVRMSGGVQYLVNITISDYVAPGSCRYGHVFDLTPDV